MLVGLSVADTRVAIRHWVARAEAVTDPHASDAREVEANLHLSRTMGGRGRLDADLDPDTTAIMEAALRVFEREDRDGEFRTLSRRRADALRDLCRFGLDHHDRRGRRGRQHPHVAVVVDLPDLYRALLWGCGVRTAEDLEAFLEWRAVSAVEEALIRHAFAHGSGQARTVDGHPLTPNAVTELFGAGTTMERLLTADGRVLEHGRAIRLATDNLRDAMVIRDRGCRFPGCDSPAAWIDAHHVHHWDQGGPTDLDNLMALCAGHHGVVHRRRWSMAVRPDGTAVFNRPDGTTLTSPPPAVTRPDRLPLHAVPPNPSSRAAVDRTPGPGHPTPHRHHHRRQGSPHHRHTWDRLLRHDVGRHTPRPPPRRDRPRSPTSPSPPRRRLTGRRRGSPCGGRPHREPPITGASVPPSDRAWDVPTPPAGDRHRRTVVGRRARGATGVDRNPVRLRRPTPRGHRSGRGPRPSPRRRPWTGPVPWPPWTGTPR